MSDNLNPYEEVRLAIKNLSQVKLTLDGTDIEYFDEEDLTNFIAVCNEVKLSAVKVLEALEHERD